MDAGTFLLRLALLFVCARVAAEVAERFSVPAVLAEIAAGIVLGPTLFDVVPKTESLHFLGELGAIFLLFEVGLHMDLREIAGVGRAAMQVAWIGVLVPAAAGFVAMRALGITGPVSLFLAAGITATSVGITARVFADAHALASTEAQTVLGAAVADDVIGLLILTVVTRLSAGGRVDVASIAAISAIGILFVVGATGIGAWLAPPLFRRIVGRSRIEGTLVAVAVAFALAFAGLAAAARLAPIVGAFVAGVALGRIPQRDELRRRVAPVGHLFVPVFFVLIGAEARLQSLAAPRVIVVAVLLGAVAIAGKIVSGLGSPRGRGDRILIGIGMIPRGEVGLVFATLGLQSGVLHAPEHAALLLVILATTVASPPLLRQRIERGRRAALAASSAAVPRGGWLDISDTGVELRGDPAPGLAPKIGVEAARLSAHRRPGRHLLDWLSAAPAQEVTWDDELRRSFVTLLREGDARSWRLLEVTGLLARLLPMDASEHRQKRDPFDLDPIATLEWEEVSALHRLVADPTDPASSLWPVVDQDATYVAAFIRSAYDDRAPEVVKEIVQTLGLPAQQAATVGFLVRERELLPAAAARFALGAEEAVLELAVHIGDAARCDALYLLASAAESDRTKREALDELHELIAMALRDRALTGGAAADVVEQRKQSVARLLPRNVSIDVRRLVDGAPRRYVLAHPPEEIARHMVLFDPPLQRGEIRLRAEPDLERGEWTVQVATLDRPGTLAALAGAFASQGMAIVEASISTWGSGLAVDLFRVVAPPNVDFEPLRRAAHDALVQHSKNGKPVAIDGDVRIDNAASPWYSIVEVRAPNRAGLLERVASAMSRSGVQIHHATVRTIDEVAVDTFLVTDKDGHKLDANGERDLRLSFEGRLSARWTPARLWRRPVETTAGP